MSPRPFTHALTKRQELVLVTFERMFSAAGAPPAVSTVAAHLNMHVSVAFRHLQALVRKGAVVKAEHGFRPVLRPVVGVPSVTVPVLGRIQAGVPREALEAPEGYVPCPPDLAGRKHLFGLKVKGDSMDDAHIHENDVVFCVKAERADVGEIVVALHHGEATVKKLGKWHGRPALMAANKLKETRYPPIAVDAETRILARVVGVYRRLG